jgi:hypothetical protein
MQNGDLMGIATNNLTRQGKLAVIRISAADRKRAVIRRQHVR